MSQKSLLVSTTKVIYPKSRKMVVHKQSDTEVLIQYLKSITSIDQILHRHCMSLPAFQGNIPTDT